MKFHSNFNFEKKKQVTTQKIENKIIHDPFCMKERKTMIALIHSKIEFLL